MEEIQAHPGTYGGVWYCCGQATLLPGKSYVYSGPMATYCAWHRPMAVCAPEVEGTFFVFGDADNAPAIGRYDHRTGRFSTPMVLGSNPDGDAHRNPTLLIDREGYLRVFYGAHGRATRALRSKRPYDVATWVSCADIPDTSYPQPWELLPGEVFVSYRGGGAREGTWWRCRKSLDGGRSWEAPGDLVAFEGCAIYGVTVAEAGPCPRRVHFAWSRLGGGTEEEARTKHLWARRYNVYYACSDDGGETWRRSDGTPYALPITEETAEKVYDCGQRGVWLKDIQLDAGGDPCVLFLDAEPGTYESVWKFARLAEGRWRFSDLTVSDHMYDDGGLVILKEDDFRVYAPTRAAQPHEDGGEIEEWRSSDGGVTWRRARSLTSGSPYSHNNVKVVFNHQRGGGDFRVFWSYGDSLFPPATREVRMYCYGEALPGPRLIEG